MIEVSHKPTEALEHQVLGRCVQFPEQCLPDVLRLLVIDDMGSRYSQGCLRALSDLSASQEPVDIYGVVTRMRDKSGLDFKGALEFVTQCVDAVYTPEHVTHYAKLVIDRSRRRRFALTAKDIVRLSESGRDVTEAVSEANQKLIDIITENEGPQPLNEILWETVEAAKAGDIPATRTGLVAVDSILGGGLLSGALIVVAGRPGDGKSAFAQQIAEHVARREGAVFFASLEMSKRDIGLRAMAAHVNATVSQLKRKDGIAALGEDGLYSLGKLFGRKGNDRFVVHDKPGQTITEIVAECRRLRVSRPLSLVVVDYLQLVHGSKKHTVREQEVAEVSRGLKCLAKDLDCPVLALAQMNRFVERNDKDPSLADLRESGAIEQDADVVAFIQRPSKDEYPTEARLVVAKNRHGRSGKIPLKFDPIRMRFEQGDC